MARWRFIILETAVFEDKAREALDNLYIEVTVAPGGEVVQNRRENMLKSFLRDLEENSRYLFDILYVTKEGH